MRERLRVMAHHRAVQTALFGAVLALLAGCGADDGGEAVTGGADAAVASEVAADLTIVGGSGAAPRSFQATVTCGPDGGAATGPLEGVADVACELLARSDIADLLTEPIPADLMCTEIYGSADTATITGTLDGEPVDRAFDRANGCGIDDWSRLQVLLPPITVDPAE
jgi:hypothetical protein